MDAHIASVEDVLIDNIDFKLKDSASYVVDRRSVSYYPLVVIHIHLHLEQK